MGRVFIGLRGIIRNSQENKKSIISKDLHLAINQCFQFYCHSKSIISQLLFLQQNVMYIRNDKNSMIVDILKRCQIKDKFLYII